VNQAAERIIFAQDGNTVHAVIEIQYEGPSESFAWVLPVPGGEPVDVGVSSKQALDALQLASNPQYNLTTVFENCGAGVDTGSAVSGPAATATPTSPGAVPPPAEVQVVAAGRVGPYDYVQLALDDSLPNPADVALEWLSENGYDVSNVGGDILGSYLEAGLDLIAFRLTKGNNTGSIRPIALSWKGDKPVIPIRPTAVAANDDMGVLVWVLGDDRAIPENYLHLELNEAKINWFNPGPTYGDVVSAAADEAGSFGFVTEQSGPASDFAPSVVPASLEYNYDYLRTGMFASIQDFLTYAISANTTFDPITFETTYYDGFLDVMNDEMALPLREGATVEQFLTCVSCYFQVDVPVRNDAYPTTPFDPAADPLLAMDVQAFLAELDEWVLMPMLDTQSLFEEYRTVTRLYTTLSAIEMTEDPVFDFNPDLEPVSNVHTGERLIQCDGRQRITLPQGIVLDTDGSTWPVSIDDELPMNLRLLQLSTEGEGEVVLDNTDRVADGLLDLGIGSIDPLVAPPEDDDADPADDTSDDDTPANDDDVADDDAADDDNEPGDDDTATTESNASGDDGCGCRVAGAPAVPRGVPAVLGTLLALAFAARRRRMATVTSN
jgi:MYXO-CTERM domain-containing protein